MQARRCTSIRVLVRSLAFLLPLLAFAGLAAAGPSTLELQRQEIDREIERELAELDTELVPLWQGVLAADDSAEELALLRQLRERAPQVDHIARRLCRSRIDVGDFAGVEDCRAALELRESGDNLAALAFALMLRDGEDGEDQAAARRMIGRAVRAEPDSASVHAIRCMIAIQLGDFDGLRNSVAELRELAPDDPLTHELGCQLALHDNSPTGLRTCVKRLREIDGDAISVNIYASILHAYEGDFDEARAAADAALAAGLDRETYDGLVAELEEGRPIWPRLLRWSAWVGLGWATGLLTLFALGVGLSRKTLDVSQRVAHRGTDPSMGARLRSIYRGVLWLTCLYYYASIPLVLLLVVGLGGGIIYAFFALGRIPIKLVAILVIGVVITIGAVLKSFFARRDAGDPGTRLDMHQHPRFRALLQDVADRVGTRPVDTVFVTPGADMAVFERGGVLKQLRGHPERCLILGIGALEGMKRRELEAILAHEYGHFSNRDTAGGGFALAVRRSTFAMAEGLVEGGAANWFNPAWVFFQGFIRIFLRISQGASRLQEVLADRWAVSLYGAAAFEGGLRHVIAREVAFGAHADAALNEAANNDRAMPNLYRYAPEEPVDVDVEAAVEEAIHATPSAYDSHPRPADRFEFARTFEANHSSEIAVAPSDEPAWDLFGDRDQLEEDMTREIRINLALQGIQIRGADDRPHEAPTSPLES